MHRHFVCILKKYSEGQCYNTASKLAGGGGADGWIGQESTKNFFKNLYINQ
jgi:hypothetical protein